jgi:hypothetical protein
MLRVVYNYVASEEDELTIRKDELLTLIETYDDNWWLVSNKRNKRGLIPFNYVKIIESVKILPEGSFVFI